MKDYFGKKKWYEPVHDNVSEILSELEKQNITFLTRIIHALKSLILLSCGVAAAAAIILPGILHIYDFERLTGAFTSRIYLQANQIGNIKHLHKDYYLIREDIWQKFYSIAEKSDNESLKKKINEWYNPAAGKPRYLLKGKPPFGSF